MSSRFAGPLSVIYNFDVAFSVMSLAAFLKGAKGILFYRILYIILNISMTTAITVRSTRN